MKQETYKQQKKKQDKIRKFENSPCIVDFVKN
jgi:hypothetical protein